MVGVCREGVLQDLQGVVGLASKERERGKVGRAVETGPLATGRQQFFRGGLGFLPLFPEDMDLETAALERAGRGV